MTTASEIKEKALAIVNDSKILLSQIDELKEWDSFTEVLNNISKIVTFVTGVVVTVENVVRDFTDLNVSSDDKLEAAASIMDDFIQGNIWLEIVDKYLFKIVINIVVHYINDKYGKLWPVDAS